MRRGFVIHHNGPPASCVGKPHSRCISFWNAVRAYHQQRWPSSNDIAYSFGICPHGERFVGRGWDKNQFANGSDDVGVDDGKDSEWYTVLVFVGGDHSTSDTETPTDGMVDGVMDVINEGRRTGRCGNRVLPHNAFKRKPCPGPQFTAYARAWDNQPLRNGQQEEDDMTPDDHKQIQAFIDGRIIRLASWLTTGRGNTLVNPTTPAWAFADDPGTVTFPKLLLAVHGVDVDEAAIAAAITPVLKDALIESLPDDLAEHVTSEVIQDAVVAGLGRVVGNVEFTPAPD